MNRDPTCRCALLTPAGAGAIGVIRLSGPGTHSILQNCLRSSSSSLRLLKEGRLSRGVLFDGAEELDDVIVSFGRSFSGFVVDVFTHGGIRVVERILELFSSLGGERVDSASTTSLAWPACTEVEREAMEQLVRAKTRLGVRYLAYQRRHLVAAIAAIEEKWTHDSAGARHDLQSLSGNFTKARRLLDGAVVAIVGRPNAGKSTLFNRLAGRTAAVVSDRAGTTRDWITEEIELYGYPITLIDTAGQREGQDALEGAAIRAGRDAVRNADLLLHVFDAAEMSSQAVPHFETDHRQARVVVRNKIDLLEESSDRSLCDSISCQSEFVAAVCARDGRGMDELLRGIALRLDFENPCRCQPCLFTDRQMHLAQEVLSDAERSTTDVRRILREIIGETSPTPVIERI